MIKIPMIDRAAYAKPNNLDKFPYKIIVLADILKKYYCSKISYDDFSLAVAEVDNWLRSNTCSDSLITTGTLGKYSHGATIRGSLYRLRLHFKHSEDFLAFKLRFVL
jgi:hypothetical protein